MSLSDKITRVACKSQGVTAMECDNCNKIFSAPTQEIWTHPDKFLPVQDVREAVRDLKNELDEVKRVLWSDETVDLLLKKIDEIFGEKLK